MMAGLLLDALLVLVVVLYVPIGAWRGGPREALLGGAILLGGAVAAAVAPRWGNALADVGGMGETSGRFVIAVAVLLATGLGIGYGAGVAAGRGLPGIESRVAGGLVGGVNAVLLLSFGLVFLQRYFHDGRSNEAVEAGLFADALTEHQGWVFGFAAIVAMALVAAVRLMEQSRDDLLEPIATESPTATPPRRRLVVAPPVDPESGKVEPAASSWDEFSAAARRRGLVEGTRPVSTASGLAPNRSAIDRGAPDLFGNGRGSRTVGAGGRGEGDDGGRSVVDEWLRRAADQPVPSSGRSAPFTDAALSNLLDPTSRSHRTALPKVDPLVGMLPRVDHEAAEPFDSPVDASAEAHGLEPDRRCPSCSTPVATSLVECPLCGGDL